MQPHVSRSTRRRLSCRAKGALISSGRGCTPGEYAWYHGARPDCAERIRAASWSSSVT
jgi:hypothetical protein